MLSSGMPMINTLSPTQKAWLAGFIDGEGFIGITFQRKKENKIQSSSPQYHPYLVVTNNDQSSILYIRKLVGDGRIYRLTKGVPSSPATFQYKLCRREVLADLLKELQPYFVVKLKQSELVSSASADLIIKGEYADVDSLIKALSKNINTRITIIRIDGKVIAESELASEKNGRSHLPP